MTIVDYFDPNNRRHLEAYAEVQRTGFWPSWFVLDFNKIEGSTITTSNVIQIGYKLINTYIAEKTKPGPKLDTKWVKEEFKKNSPGGLQARLSLKVTVDGVDCGTVCVASGPAGDVHDLIAGQCTLPELQERWAPKKRRPPRLRGQEHP